MSKAEMTSMLALLAVAAGPAMAQDAVPHKPVCIRAYEINRTSIPNDGTILFYMNDHRIWKNTLTGRCVGLRLNTRGFTYSPTDPGTDEICSNLQTIRVNDTGQVCLMGEFTPITPADAKALDR